MIQSMTNSIPEMQAVAGGKITLNVSDAGMNVDKQISDVRTATVKGPSILPVDPVDPAKVLPTLKAAKDAGNKLFSSRPADSDPAGLCDGTFAFSVETPYADDMKGRMNSLLDADPNLVLKVAIICGGAAQKGQLGLGDVVKALAAAFILGAGDIDLSIIGVAPFVGAVVAWLVMMGGWPDCCWAWSAAC